MRRLNKNILQERSDIIFGYQYEVLGEYLNNYTPIEVKHKICGNIFYQRPSNHLLGKGCTICNKPSKGSVDYLQSQSDLKFDNKYKIVGEYIDNQTKIEILHLECNNLFNITPSGHIFSKKGSCPICFVKNAKKTQSQFIEESNKIHNSEYEIIGKYISTDVKIEIRHKICGKVFLQTPYKHLNNNKCPICFGKHKLSANILQERSDNKYGKGEYNIMGEYINNYTPILISHNICGNIYTQLPSNHLKRKCRFCNIKTSNGELEIEILLNRYKINFEKFKKFETCKYKQCLPFDFYLPDKNICIEYDGELHFISKRYFGGDKKLELTVLRDNIKTNWCRDNNINLIRIPYTERKNIEKIISSL